MSLTKVRILPLILSSILLVQFLLPPIPVSANPDENITALDTDAAVERVDGAEISLEDFGEFYYWDMEKKDDKEVPVIYGKGGKYLEPIKLELESEDGEHGDVYLPVGDALPVEVPVPDDEKNELCGKGAPFDMEDGKPTNIKFHVAKDGSTMAIDLINDGSNGEDSFELAWYSEVDATDQEKPTFIERSTNTQEGWLKRKTDAIYDALGKVDVLRMAEEKITGEKKLNIEIYTCSYVIKDYFNTFIAPYSPFDVVDGDFFEGKLLGKKGMKFIDWLRQVNNIRDYLALSKSASYEIINHCHQFKNPDGCNNRLSFFFQRCYVRAIGIEDTTNTSFMSKDDPFMPNRVIEQYIKPPDLLGSIWNHTIKTSLSPFATCFGGKRYAPNQEHDRSFNSPQEGIAFGQRIVHGTVFPRPIFPIDVDEVEDPTIPRDKAETKCSLGKMGWLLCPTISFLSKITDRLFSLIQQWLVVPPILAGDDKAAFVAWKFMRNFANIFFIIFLLIVIASQVAGGGNTAYALRTIIPRLIVIALLINLSFYICSFALDVSNVMGSSLYGTIRGLSPPGSPVNEFRTWESVTSAIVLGGGGAALLAAGMLAGLAALVPMLIMTFISMTIVLLSLLLRQSLIIILIIIAPLAFVLKLLPGTDSWYQKWQTMFTQMLFLYPTIAIVFAGAYFASNIIVNQAAVHGNATLAIFAMAIQIIPLFITPVIMKFGGGAINSFGGMIKGGLKAPADKINKAAKQSQEDRNVIKDTQAAYRHGKLSRRSPIAAIRRARMRRDYKRKVWNRDLDRARGRAVSESSALTNIAAVSGGGLNRDAREDIRKALDNELTKLRREDVSVAQVHLQEDLNSQNFDDAVKVNKELLSILENGSEEERIAAIKQIAQNGDVPTIHAVIDALNVETGKGSTAAERHAFVESLEKSSVGRGAAHLTTKSGLRAIADGTATTGSLYRQAYAENKYNAATMASQSADSIAGMGQYFNDVQIGKVTNEFFKATNNERTSHLINPASTEALGNIQPGRRRG